MEEGTSLESAAEAIEQALDTQNKEMTQEEPIQTEESEQEFEQETTNEAEEVSEDNDLSDYELEDAVYKLPKELKEHIEKLKQSEFRESDYTRKTQALAEERKRLDSTVAERVQAEMQRVNQELELYKGLAEAQGIKPPDEKLLDDDPVEFLKQQRQFEALQQSKSIAERKLQQEHQALVQEETRKLIEADPSWSDQAVFRKELGEIVQHLKSYGASDAEIGNIADHRIFLMARDAKRYRELSSKTAAVEKKLIKAPAKVERPGVSGSGSDHKQRDTLSRLRKTGSRDDAAAAIMARLT